MQRVAAVLPIGATPEQAREVLVEHPALAAYLAAIERGNKPRRRKVLEEVYGPEVASVLLPARARGGARVAKYGGPWALLSGPARDLVAQAIGASSLDATTAGDWDSKTVSIAADTLVDKYLAGSPSSAAMALRGLRAGLLNIGVSVDVSAASVRPDVTRLHNERISSTREERVAAGINVPEPFSSLDALKARVQRFIADPTTVSAQTAADVLVSLSARPGEAETITLGDKGGIRGVLKKKSNKEQEFNLVTAIGEDLARDLIAAWKGLTPRQRQAAMVGLTPLVHSWSLQKRDMRAIGAALAVKAEILAGRAANVGQQRRVHAAALRHEPAPRAQDHYERVNDPLAQLCAQLSELSVSQLEAVKGLVATLRP